MATFPLLAFFFVLRAASRWLVAGRWCGSFGGVPGLAFVYSTVLMGTSVCLGVGEALQYIVGEAVDHIGMVVAFSTVVAGEISTSVYMPFSLDRGVLGVKGKFIGGVFHCPSYGFP